MTEFFVYNQIRESCFLLVWQLLQYARVCTANHALCGSVQQRQSCFFSTQGEIETALQVTIRASTEREYKTTPIIVHTPRQLQCKNIDGPFQKNSTQKPPSEVGLWQHIVGKLGSYNMATHSSCTSRSDSNTPVLINVKAQYERTRQTRLIYMSNIQNSIIVDAEGRRAWILLCEKSSEIYQQAEVIHRYVTAC